MKELNLTSIEYKVSDNITILFEPINSRPFKHLTSIVINKIKTLQYITILDATQESANYIFNKAKKYINIVQGV